MDVTAADRHRLQRQQAVLQQHEEQSEAEGRQRAGAVAAANSWRSAHEIAPLRDEADRPELGLHELARSRGLLSAVR